MEKTNYNVTIDKNYVYAAQLPRVKKAAKEFKSVYTLRDVLSHISESFAEKFPYVTLYSEDVLRMDIEFFGGNAYFTEDDYSDINMKIEFFMYGISQIHHIILYANYNFEVRLDLIRCNTYTR